MADHEDDRKTEGEEEPEEDRDHAQGSEDTKEEGADSRRKPGEGVPDIPPEPGMTAPLHHLRPEEENISPAGQMPGGGPDDARETAAPETKDRDEEPAKGEDGEPDRRSGAS